MKYSNYNVFSTDCKTHGIRYAAERTKEFGFDAVEFIEATTPLYRELDMGEVREVLERYGLSVACCSALMDLTAPDYDKRERWLFEVIEFAHKVGSPYIHHTLVPSLTLDDKSPDYRDVLKTVLPRAERIANKCAENGIVCLYEPQGMYFNGAEGLGEFFDIMKSRCESVGICGDFGNSLFVDVSASDIYDRFIDDIKHVHIKDYKVSQDKSAYITRAGNRIIDCRLGDGVTDCNYLFDKLKKSRYDGALSFEICDDETLVHAFEYVKKHY